MDADSEYYNIYCKEPVAKVTIYTSILYFVIVINADNKMITLARIGRIIWINQIIKRITNTITNNI